MTDEVKYRISALKWASVHGDCTDADDACPVHKDCMRFGTILCDIQSAADLIESLSAELEKVERERNAAIEDLRDDCCVCAHKKTCSGPWCAICDALDKCTSPCRSCIGEHNNWQWRGPQEAPND